MANADSYVIPYYAGSFISAPGVLANDTDPNQGAQLFAHLVSGPSHASTFQLNQDGSFHYATNNTYLGPDSFTYKDTDTYGMSSNTVAVTLNVEYSVQSTTDLTKQVAINPLDTGLQILGSAGGAPASAQNLSLAYDSVAAQPDAVIEGLFQFNTITPINDTATGTLTFNGVAQPATYVNLNGMNGSSANVDLSYQVDTSALPTGRYPYTLTLNGNYMAAPATITGAVNVVNDSSGPVGKGWDIPGLYRLYQNNVSGVPAGVLLTTGEGGHSWYFTQGSGSSYTSPHGPFAFDTLTSVTGGGWKLVDKGGTTFNFGSTGNLLTSAARTGETTTYTSTSGLLASITDPFSRSVNLGYTSGQLSSVTDYAGHVWSIAHTGANLTSVTEPNVAGGSPARQYGYSGNYLSTVTDPNNNQTGYVLDSHHRLSGVNLPGGASTSDTSEQSLAYGGSTYAGAPNVTPSANAQTTSVDANNNSTSMQTDVFGNPLSLTDPYGHTTTWQRDANGLVTTLTQPSPDGIAAAPVTNYSYDSLGNETSASGGNPTYGTFVYNAFSEPTSFTDSQNHVRTWLYDANGNLLSETDPLNNTVSHTVDSLGYRLTMTQPAPNNGTGTVTTTYTRDQMNG
ncbi:MAG TPA: Ig-like domain-containing protein [Pirellulales bacterium]|nr:Ig-like domain-containing protein [Pirellulales bacterium]